MCIRDSFRCLIWPRLILRKAQSYRRTKFRPDISIHGRDITTSGFWKQTAAILKFYFWFQFWPLTAISMWFSIGTPNFVEIWSSDFHGHLHSGLVAVPDVIACAVQTFGLKFSGVTILQWVEFPIFLLILAWALQQCSANMLPVINVIAYSVSWITKRATLCSITYYSVDGWHSRTMRVNVSNNIM